MIPELVTRRKRRAKTPSALRTVYPRLYLFPAAWFIRWCAVAHVVIRAASLGCKDANLLEE